MQTMPSLLILLAAASFGVASWSLAEYILHRYLGHDRRTRPNLFEREHTRHHSEGNYFGPTWMKALAALAVLAVMLPPALWLGGAALGTSYVLAFVGMYITYEVIHRKDHTQPARTRYGRWARRHHFHHHFGNPRSNHGVTSPIWDHVFGTYEEPALIRVPERLQMCWLAEPDTGTVRREFAGEYDIIPARR